MKTKRATKRFVAGQGGTLGPSELHCFLIFVEPGEQSVLYVQVAAVDEPKLHLWETGVMRITRHPQTFGQALWCLAHTLWIGSSFMVATTGALMAHHAFSCWHGDFRLRRKYGPVRSHALHSLRSPSPPLDGLKLPTQCLLSACCQCSESALGGWSLSAMYSNAQKLEIQHVYFTFEIMIQEECWTFVADEIRDAPCGHPMLYLQCCHACL